MDEQRYFRVISDGQVCPLVRQAEDGKVKLLIGENTEAWYDAGQVQECEAPAQRGETESP